MKRRFRKSIICCFLVLFFCGVSVWAISESSVNYHFFSKKTAVRVEQYTQKNGTYVLWEDTGITILPGEFLSRIPIIYNEGIDCYIRAQIKITSESVSNVPITLEHIVGMGEKWILIDGYFYYQDVLLEEEEVNIFEGIYIPTEWTDSVDSGNPWELEVKVDAIQAKHLVPDFQSEDPWGEKKEKIDILDAKDEETLENDEVQEEFTFTIQSEVTTFQIGIEEAFQNIGGFVPGDVKKCEIRIRNLDKTERILYMNADVQQDDWFMNKMEVTILWECDASETILYQGTISEMCNAWKRITLVVPGDEEGILHVIFSLPKAVGNDCAVQEGSCRFLFSDERIPTEPDNMQDDFMSWLEDTDLSSGSAEMDDFEEKDNDSNGKASDAESGVQGNSTVKTGDDSKIWNGIVGMCIAVCLFFLYIWKGKRGSHD